MKWSVVMARTFLDRAEDNSGQNIISKSFCLLSCMIFQDKNICSQQSQRKAILGSCIDSLLWELSWTVALQKDDIGTVLYIHVFHWFQKVDISPNPPIAHHSAGIAFSVFRTLPWYLHKAFLRRVSFWCYVDSWHRIPMQSQSVISMQRK